MKSPNQNLESYSSEKEILFSKTGSVGHIILNRPNALNSITENMTSAMFKILKLWLKDDNISIVVIEGASQPNLKRPFCSGGDIRMIFEGRKDPQRKFAQSFFSQEYRLNKLIYNYPKPYLSLIDGVVMGGGVGISIHGSHRVMTDRALFAMPETGIGLFPDVGATHFLPRLTGLTGLYLGLTSQRLEVADCLHLGIATHYLPSSKYSELIKDIMKEDYSRDPQSKLDNLLEKHCKKTALAPIIKRLKNINKTFDSQSIEEIFENLRAKKNNWSISTLKELSQKSPTSLKVTFRQLTELSSLDFDNAMKMEYRMAIRFNFSDDLFEGIRAFIIDKDFSPVWDPGTIESVCDKVVDEYFQEPDSGDIKFC